MEGLKFRGRPPILIAKSVKGVVSLTNEYAQNIISRKEPINQEFANAIIAQSVMSWEGRNPRPALDQDGNFQCSDLDLLSFLTPIAARGAVIEIPRYRNRRQVVIRPNERKIGNNQFGPITGLISHQEALSFSVRISDNTIIKKDWSTGRENVGGHRNYMVVDCDGHWYQGWDRIIWNPSAEENRFLAESKLWTGHTVYFKNYVHPNRWQSIFSAQYLLKKMLISRINDEADFYAGEVKRLWAAGIRFPFSNREEYLRPSYEGETIPIRIGTIEVILDIPEFSGTYKTVPNTQKGLVEAYQRQKYLTYVLRPQVQFGVRANEAAYFLYGRKKIASWMEGRRWKPWKAPKGKIEWNQMILSPDVALRWRIKTITQRVSAE